MEDKEITVDPTFAGATPLATPAEAPELASENVVSVAGVRDLGSLDRMDPREIWRSEPQHFTPWLLANAQRLGSALGIDVELSNSEHAVGPFSLDLIGRDLTHDVPLIVENQLAESDHTHLGQLLTYAAGTSAATIVWITIGFRDQHRQALSWLNEQTGDTVRFFGVEIEVVRIGSSLPAPLFNVVALPSDWQQQVRAQANAAKVGGRAALYHDFWTRYLERLRTEHPNWTKASTPHTANWISMPSPIRGTGISVSFAAGAKLRHELYIDANDAGFNEHIYQSLAAQKDMLETAYGRQLSWEPLPGRRASRIAEYTAGDVADQDQYNSYIDWFFDAGTRLRRALEAVEPPTTYAPPQPDEIGEPVLEEGPAE